ncbi:Bug family tripartite tricarboxylate transporter substrate binding protein [Variovorax fucosicus]|uniref:Bug family tripartite tricarboxylate transporter substrate binding protein n=1 Tax=Variovorax fucosicus TaxID=3053517 RepID=UPI0025753726|nr:tripartite tricarboxylate transporter substrate binding protein [Variovorax sp. J22G47]MDM0054812.1 tripartite tricarboxylate transporter substrate binding protein [Variovorax sp. J22G47]
MTTRSPFSFQRRRVCQSLALLATGGASALHAQGAWPQKPIRLVVPFAPGGSSEVVARSVAGELTKQLGQSVFVENKPGGAGVIAMQEVAKAGADGYTLILGHVGTLAVNPYMLPSQPYDVNKDFIPVTLLAKVPNVLVVHPDVPAKTFKEFIAYAKANPGKVNYSSAGNGSSGHLSMEYLKLTAGFFMTHIPYRGSGPQMTDLLAGRVQVAMNGLPSVSAFIKSGKLRALAVGSAQRIAALPDVPTIAESGYKGFETSQWYGLLAPAGTPAPVVKRLQEESLKALRTGPVTERFAHDSAVGVGDTPEQFAAFIAAQQKVWKDIVAKAGIKPD